MMIHCPICGIPCGNEGTLKHHVKAKHDMDLLSVESIEAIEIEDEETFQKGQWVDLVDNQGKPLNAFVLSPYNKFCVLEIIGAMPNKPYKPIRGSVLNPYLKVSPDKLNDQELEFLIDLALQIGDKEWFLELTGKRIGIV